MTGAARCFWKLSMDSHRHELETELTGTQSHCSKGEICTSELSLHLGLSRLHKVMNRDTVFTEDRTTAFGISSALPSAPMCSFIIPVGFPQSDRRQWEGGVDRPFLATTVFDLAFF